MHMWGISHGQMGNSLRRTGKGFGICIALRYMGLSGHTLSGSCHSTTKGLKEISGFFKQLIMSFSRVRTFSLIKGIWFKVEVPHNTKHGGVHNFFWPQVLGNSTE